MNSENVEIGFIKTQGFGVKTIDDSKDCTVRSLSLFFEIDYNEAHKVCFKYGRRDKHGMNYEQFIKAFKSLKRKTGKNGVNIARSGFVSSIIAKYPKDTLLFSVRGHVFTVKDSVIMDTFKPSEKCHVIHAFLLKKEEGINNDK